jgi:hypothetical protein
MGSLKKLSCYKEESESTVEITKALCAAAPGFLPIILDAEGTRDGILYRYATLGSIRRSVGASLWANGVFMNHEYSEKADGAEYVTTNLRHTSGEFLSSTSPVHYYPDAQEHKARKTMTCKTHVEGLLSITVEEDTDGGNIISQPEGAIGSIDPSTTKTLSSARMAIETARTVEVADEKITKVKDYITEGKLPAEVLPEFVEIVRKKFNVPTYGEDHVVKG